MKNPTDFAYYLSKYFNVFLKGCRNLSGNTISAYGHTFRLLIRFFEEKRSVQVSRLSLKHIDRQAFVTFWTGYRKDGRALTLHETAVWPLYIPSIVTYSPKSRNAYIPAKPLWLFLTERQIRLF